MIKFRAWDKKDEVIQEVTGIEWSIEYVEFMGGAVERAFEDVILMQSTGLKDKNGVEIYQDDVVNMCWSDEIGESHWGKITIKNPFDYCIEEARYLIHADELEVIGNIYANPELLSSGIE